MINICSVMTEDEMVGWHHRLNGHEFGWTPGVGDRQGGLGCCSPWGHKESNTTEQLNWTEQTFVNEVMGLDVMSLVFWMLSFKPAFSLSSFTLIKRLFSSFTLSAFQFSHSVMSSSLWHHGLQHAGPPCPSSSPRVCSNSCPLSQWCHPIISSSVIPFSSHLQSFPASGSF